MYYIPASAARDYLRAGSVKAVRRIPQGLNDVVILLEPVPTISSIGKPRETLCVRLNAVWLMAFENENLLSEVEHD